MERSLSPIGCVGAVVWLSSAAVGDVMVVPAVDYAWSRNRKNTGFTTVEHSQCYVGYFDDAGIPNYDRGAMEFDLSVLPVNIQITAVTLNLAQYYGFWVYVDQTMAVQINGFVDDGEVTAADVLADTPAADPVVYQWYGTGDQYPTWEEGLTVDLTDYIGGFSDRYAGIALSGVPEPLYGWILGLYPETGLVVEYDLPEPTSMALLALGGMALIRRRRRVSRPVPFRMVPRTRNGRTLRTGRTQRRPPRCL